MNSTIFETLTLDKRAACQLSDKQIDVWQFSLKNLPPLAFALLNEEEKLRSERFYFSRHSRRFIVARAMMRKILGFYLDVDPKKLEFAYSKHGKPFLSHDNQEVGIEFNLSHSADLALLAIGKTYPLGVDVEQFSERPFADISQKMFSPDEIAALQRMPEHLQCHAFFKIWAQKEAFIKACGLGLAYPTEEFTVSLDEGPYSLSDPKTGILWKMVSFMPESSTRAHAALCYDPLVTHLRKITIDPVEWLYL